MSLIVISHKWEYSQNRQMIMIQINQILREFCNSGFSLVLQMHFQRVIHIFLF